MDVATYKIWLEMVTPLIRRRYTNMSQAISPHERSCTTLSHSVRRRNSNSLRLFSVHLYAGMATHNKSNLWIRGFEWTQSIIDFFTHGEFWIAHVHLRCLRPNGFVVCRHLKIEMRKKIINIGDLI